MPTARLLALRNAAASITSDGADPYHPDLEQRLNERKQGFRRWVVGKHVGGEWNGHDVAVLSWWHTETNGVGLEDFAMHPDQADRHANEFIKRALGREVADPDLIPIAVPLYDKYTCVRSTREIPFKSLHLEFAKNPPNPPSAEMTEDLPKSFLQHPVRVKALQAGFEENQIRPISFYQDGVAFNQKETFEGFFIKDLYTGTAYLQALVRMQLSCTRTLLRTLSVCTICLFVCLCVCLFVSCLS